MEQMVMVVLTTITAAFVVHGLVIDRAQAQAQAPIATPSTSSLNSNIDYCSRSLVGKTCPTLPTPSSLDLDTLLGSYYEIGSTAHYKFRNELGITCTHTNFTIDPSESSEDSVTVNVLSSGIPVVQGQQTLSALSRISASFSNVCSGVSQMCSIMSPQTKIYEANIRISAVANELSSSNPIGSSTLNQISINLNNSIFDGIHSHLDRISRSINIATGIISSGLNQGVGASDLVLRAVRESVGVAIDDVRDLASTVVYNLTSTSSLIEQVMSHIPTRDMSNARELLQEALALIDEELDDVITQVSTLQGQLLTIQGPLVEMVAADYRSTRLGVGGRPLNDAANRTAKAERNEQAIIQSLVQGSDGSLMLDNNLQQVDNSSTSAQPLQVIALEGGVPIGVGEYSALLVYTCNIDANGNPSTDLLLLSRTPTLTPQAVINFISIANSLGVFTDCDNPFVPTLQRPDCANF